MPAQSRQSILTPSISLFIVFCLITQLFLQRSEPVKATKCCTLQFVALRQSGICPKVIHSAISCQELNLKAKTVPPQHLEWPMVRLGLSNQLDTATVYTAEFTPRVNPKLMCLDVYLIASIFLV